MFSPENLASVTWACAGMSPIMGLRCMQKVGQCLMSGEMGLGTSGGGREDAFISNWMPMAFGVTGETGARDVRSHAVADCVLH